MKRIQFNISDLLKFARDNIADIGTHVFVANRPNLTDTQMKDFIIISLPYSIQDYIVFQTTTIRIEIAVRCKNGNVENVARLQELLDKITEKMPMADGNKFRICRPKLALKGSDITGFSFWCIQAEADIYTTDRLN